MRNILSKILFSQVTFLFILFAGPNTGWSAPVDQSSMTQDKIYCDPHQIELTDSGIIFYGDSEVQLPIGASLSHDENGLYLDLTQFFCAKLRHQPKCGNCGGCRNPCCPDKCDCP